MQQRGTNTSAEKHTTGANASARTETNKLRTGANVKRGKTCNLRKRGKVAGAKLWFIPDWLKDVRKPHTFTLID